MDFLDFKVNQKRDPGMEFVGERSEGILESYNLPMADTRGWGEIEIKEKRAPGMEFVGEKSSWDGIYWEKSSWDGICGEKSSWNGICWEKILQRL